MARLVNNGDICEVTLLTKANDQICMNTTHYRVTGISDGSDGTAIANEFGILLNGLNGYVQQFAKCVSQELVIQDLTIQWIYGKRYTRQSVGVVAGAGAVLIAMLPQNVSIALYKTTEEANRRNRGFYHLPGVPSNFNDFGNVSAAGLTPCNNLAGQLKLSYTLTSGGTMTPVIFNRAEPQKSPTVLQCKTQLSLRTVRRRTVGVGI